MTDYNIEYFTMGMFMMFLRETEHVMLKSLFLKNKILNAQ